MSGDDNEQFRLDKGRVRRGFEQAATTYDNAAVLQREVAARVIDRFELIRVQPKRILDVGAGTGAMLPDLMKRFPKAEIVALDPAVAMLRRARRRGRWLRRPLSVCGDGEHLPFRTGSFDLVISNLTLHWLNDPERAFSEFLRVLEPEGLLLFSTLGPDTLQELRQSWAEVDDYNHVNAFMDMHDVGDALVRTQFADPVMDMESFTLTYGSVSDLMRDLKHLGGRNATQGRPRGLTGRNRLRQMEQAYERWRTPSDVLPATFEVIYGHAWAPAQRPQRRDSSGAVSVPLSSIGRRGA